MLVYAWSTARIYDMQAPLANWLMFYFSPNDIVQFKYRNNCVIGKERMPFESDGLTHYKAQHIRYEKQLLFATLPDNKSHSI